MGTTVPPHLEHRSLRADERVAVAATTSLGFEADVDGQHLDSLIAEGIEGGRQTRHRLRSLVGPVAQLFANPSCRRRWVCWTSSLVARARSAFRLLVGRSIRPERRTRAC